MSVEGELNEKALNARMRPEMMAHIQNPGRPIDWEFWTQPPVLGNMLRSLLMGSSDILIQLGYRTAVETIRRGKTVWHWNLDVENVISSMLAGKMVEATQTFALSELAQSPLLLEASEAVEFDFHPDMITVVALCKLGQTSATALKLDTERDILHIFFELVYDPEHQKALDPTIQTMKSVRLGNLGPLNRCHNCRVELTSAVKCNACQVATYCSKKCMSIHRPVAHKNVCLTLQRLCSPRSPGCFRPAVFT